MLLILVFILAVTSVINVFAPLPEFLVKSYTPPAQKPVLALANFGLTFLVYGLVGWLGLKLSTKALLPGVYKKGETVQRLFYNPLKLGVISGSLLILIDQTFSRLNGVGSIPHPLFPFSINAALAAGIGEEIMMRLFLISFWVFMLSFIFKNRKIVIWAAIIISALVFGIGHFPSMMLMYGFQSLNQFSAVFIIEILLLNGIIGILCGRFFVKYGLIAAIGIHFWTDIIWHVFYGLV